VVRFLVGVAIGSEWATAASIVSELWPDHARGKGGGLLQCGAGLGSILASLVWLAITSETLGGAIGADMHPRRSALCRGQGWPDPDQQPHRRRR
jgi:MFS family permease